MNLGFDFSQRLQQKLSFHMVQSLKMLQVNTLQLEQMLRTELEQNPVLELEADMAMDFDMDADADMEYDREERTKDDDDRERGDDDGYLEEIKGGEDGIDWEEYLEEGFDLGYSYNEEADPSEERYDSSPVYQETLEEHLTNQLSEKNVGERVKLLIQYLIGSLDEDGYLRMSIEDITNYTDATICEAEEALNVLWRLDPAGVGARDLRECMILQLRARKMRDSLAMKIVTDHWEAFEKLKVLEISKRLNVEPREVQEAVEIIKTLNPKPGYQYNADKPSHITPDVIVEKVDGKFIVMLNDRSLPALHISKSYANMIRRGSKARKDVKEYVREKFNSATWFIRAIEQRRATILKVMNAIVKYQKVFFDKGPPNIVPLKMQEVAEMIEMHSSTVSRVASNKYAQTPYGIFELRYFFTEAVSKKKGAESDEPGEIANDDGEETAAGDAAGVTAERIRSRIRQIIDDEDPKAPVTDQKIAEILEKENLPAARRTVAKYREQMKISPVRMRIKYD